MDQGESFQGKSELRGRSLGAARRPHTGSLGSTGSRACCNGLLRPHRSRQEALGLKSCPTKPSFTHTTQMTNRCYCVS